jgi:hypothetical protein
MFPLLLKGNFIGLLVLLNVLLHNFLPFILNLYVLVNIFSKAHCSKKM